MRKISGVLSTLAALAVLAGTPSPAAAGKLTLSTGMWVGYGALYLARDLGYFKEAGVEVELLQSEDPLSFSASLASGAVSGSAAEVDIMLPIRKTVCAKGVVALDDSSGADGILTTDAITELRQLKGQSIAVSEPGYPNVFLGYALQQAGLQRSDVTLMNMRPDDAAAAFIAGRVAVAVTYEPSLTFVADAHQGRVLFNSSQAPGLIADLVYLRCEVIEQQPQDVRALVAALFKADDYIAAHPDEAYDIMRKYVGGFLATRADFAAAAKGVKYYDRAMNLKFLGTKAQPGDVMATVGFVEQVWGPIVEHYSYDALFDPSFIQ
jgi:NitT/TauT family transport system substrate-binding protein